MFYGESDTTKRKQFRAKRDYLRSQFRPLSLIYFVMIIIFFSGLFSSSGTEKMVAYDLYGKDFLKWDLLFCLKAFYRRFLCVLAYEGREEDELEKKKK